MQPVAKRSIMEADDAGHEEEERVENLPYVVRQDEDDGRPVYVLEDRAARAEVWVAPGLGCNAYRFDVQPGEHELAIVEPPPTLGELEEYPSRYGTPVLFPFPGRVASGRFTFRGRAYELQRKLANGNAIHGFVYERPWQVIAWGTSERDGAVLVCRFESQAFPELAAQYPSAYRLDLTFRLRGWTLGIEARAENVGHEPLPLGYGLHPYFRAPIDHGASAGGCVIEAPVSRRWELADLLPTGRILPLEEDLPSGVSLEGRAFDDVYTGVLGTEGSSRSILSDTKARLAVVVEADRQFREWVVYTPPRPAVCFEPYTCVPDALNLQSRGIDAGLIVLEPGEWRSWAVRMSVRET